MNNSHEFEESNIQGFSPKVRHLMRKDIASVVAEARKSKEKISIDREDLHQILRAYDIDEYDSGRRNLNSFVKWTFDVFGKKIK